MWRATARGLAGAAPRLHTVPRSLTRVKSPQLHALKPQFVPVKTPLLKTVSSTTVAGPDRALGYWLLGCSGMVGGMILLGGVTRLTRSGLSMVDWRPQGGLPPITDEEWDAEFEKYKQFPEYQTKSSVAKTVDDFKPIYYLEWGGPVQ